MHQDMACRAGILRLVVVAAAAAAAAAAAGLLWGPVCASPLPLDVPCSKQEHECISLGRLLNPEDGRCYAVEGLSPCKDRALPFHASRGVAMGGAGLHGECARAPCQLPEVIAAATGRCESVEDIDKLCGGVVQMSGLKNAFGEAVCDVAGADLTPPSPPQPPYSGRCRLPAWLRAARAPAYVNRLSGSDTPCSPQELSCYDQGQVLLNGSCWALRERGPCAEGEWLVLDHAQLPFNQWGYVSSEHARIQAVCKKRSCAQGLVQPVPGSAAGPACLSPSALRRRFCGREAVAVDVLGLAGCVGFPLTAAAGWKELPKAGAPGRCHLPPPPPGTYAAVYGVGGVACARSDGGDCTARVLETKAPFILLPED